MSAMFSRYAAHVARQRARRAAAPRADRRLISALVNAEDDQETLARHEIAPFFILLAVAGNDTARTAISHGMHLLSQNPDQRRRWQADLGAVTPTAVEEIVRVASPVTFMRRTATRSVTLSAQEFLEGDKVVLLYGVANRDPRVFDAPESFDVLRDESPWGSAAPVRTSVSARTSRVESSPLPSANSSTDCRTSKPPTSPHRSRRWVFRSSVASSAFQCGSRPQRSRVGT